MNSAEFRTLRQSLLLSEKDVSMLTMAKEGRIKAWEAGITDIPKAEAGLLKDIDRRIDKSMADAMKAAKGRKQVTLVRFLDARQFEEAGPDMHPIPKFLAFKCHSALIMRLRMVFLASGKKVIVRYHK